MAGYCEQDNETLGSVNRWEFLQWLDDCCLVQNPSTELVIKLRPQVSEYITKQAESTHVQLPYLSLKTSCPSLPTRPSLLVRFFSFVSNSSLDGVVGLSCSSFSV